MEKIAVIDDISTFRIFVKQILELNPEYQVDPFESAEELFKSFAKLATYNLIIVDVNLNGMNGITALENLKTNEKTRKIPVLLVTGEPAKKVVERAIQFRVNGFLSKPIEPEVLTSRVNKLLGYPKEKPNPKDVELDI